jgi:hypothetical protein
MRDYPGKIQMRIDLAASMGSGVAMTPGAHVSMWKTTSMMMIHRASNIAFGNADEIENAGRNTRKIEDMLVENYLARANGKLRERELRDMLEAETVLNAKEAKSYGLIDKILTTDGPAKAMMNLGQGINLDLSKFAAKMAQNSSLRDDLEEIESVNDLRAVLTGRGRMSRGDVDTLVARVKDLTRENPGGSDPRENPDDSETVSQAITALQNINLFFEDPPT